MNISWANRRLFTFFFRMLANLELLHYKISYHLTIARSVNLLHNDGLLHLALLEKLTNNKRITYDGRYQLIWEI